LTYQILDELFADGIWFSEELFRLSPSYAPLQGVDEFEKRVQANIKLRAQSGDDTAAVLHTRIPETGKGPYPVIFHLHGNGSSALAEIDHWQAAVDAGWLVAAPNSATIFWAGSDALWRDHETARAQIAKHVEELQINFELDTDNIIFTGFSMGGEIALAETLRGELAPARGFIIIGAGGPMLEDTANFKPLIETAQKRNLRGAILVSESDAAIQDDKLEEMAELLNTGGIPTQFEKYPDIGHVFPSDFGKRLPGLLAWVAE